METKRRKPGILEYKTKGQLKAEQTERQKTPQACHHTPIKMNHKHGDLIDLVCSKCFVVLNQYCDRSTSGHTNWRGVQYWPQGVDKPKKKKERYGEASLK